MSDGKKEGHGERVAIVGSRGYSDLHEVWDFVRSLPPGTVVVSGGAKGVDAEAEEAAGECGLEVLSLRPDYAALGKRAPLERNVSIAKACDRMVAFHDGNSRGTAHAIECAKAEGKPVEVRKAKQRGGGHEMYRDGKRIK